MKRGRAILGNLARNSARLLVAAGLVLLFGCAGGAGESNASGGIDAGPPCIDRDNDGFGRNCAFGRDCDDSDPRSTNECRACAHPEVGCGCAPTQQPISCFLPDQVQADGAVMCREGTRYCRDELWSQCEDVHSYLATPDPSLSALINPDAAPENCSICDIRCFKVTDPLLTTDAGAGGGLTYTSGGGLQLAPGDGGTSGDGGGSGSTLSGCTGLTACCTTLGGAPEAQNDCEVIAAGGDEAACDDALTVYCPSIIDGPVDGCTVGGSSLDADCDGIPDSLDECTPETIDTNPDCDGSVLPLSSTNNQTIFHILDKGESGSNSLEIGFKVQNADVYFLMDMSHTMSRERDNLVDSMVTGNYVECALLENCCEKLSGTDQTNCLSVVNNDNQTNCQNAEATYCSGMTFLTDCPDTDLDGQPNNELKTGGVVGAIRCLVGSAWFGAGHFGEIPFHGETDERAFRHYADMTPDGDKVRDAIQQFRTNRNDDLSEGHMVGLYSLLTGKGHMFGHDSQNVPDRLGLGCPANTFGYPCFRNNTIPIVLMFTDASMHNGPPTYDAPYDASYTINTKAPSSGVARFTPQQSESFGTAFNLGDVRDQFLITSGHLRWMTGDYPASITGCGAQTAAPDAVYRFVVSPTADGSPASVKFAMNTTLDSGGYSGSGNGPSPATETPVVLSLYRGVPSTVQAPIDVGETRINPIPSGPDLAYLTYVGTTGGTMESAPGFLGGISGCGADGATNEVIFTFRPTVDARVVIDAAESAFNTALSLHRGLPQSLPANPSGSDSVVLVGSGGNTNDTFDTAIRVDGTDAQIDGDYVTYAGDLLPLQDSGSGSTYNTPAGRTGLDDYDASVLACGLNSGGADAVFTFEASSRRRLRIDTEGSSIQTVVSLHDGPPPRSFTETAIAGNGTLATAYRIGAQSNDSVSNTEYHLVSDANGTSVLMDAVAPQCGGIATAGSNEAYYSFRLDKSTRLHVSAAGIDTATGNEAVNSPGQANYTASSNPPPATPGADPVINEFVFDHTGTDSKEFIELFGAMSTSYSGLKLLVLEGDSEQNPGNVNKIITPGSTDSAGLWISAFFGDIEDGTATLLLVEGSTVALNADLDGNNDGTVDNGAAWSRVVDGVAVHDGGSGDLNYAGAPVLTASFDGGSSKVGGASRIPSGADTDAVSDWARNDFDGDGLPGFGFDPIVFLYSSPPGSATTRNAADPNADGSTVDSNTHNTATLALDLGDVYGQGTTKVINADLGHANSTNDYASGVVGCNDLSIINPAEHVYEFTPTNDGTLRVQVSTLGSAYHAVGIYDGPPPISGAIGTTQLFDASKLTPAPDSSCTAHSESGRIYWFCANARSWSDAEGRCTAAGGSLVRVDNADENGWVGTLRTSDQTWIGGYDISNNEWVWSDTDTDQFWSGGNSGSALLYANWGHNQPNNVNQECASFFFPFGTYYYQWADRPCAYRYHYVCEIPSPSPVPNENQGTAYLVGSEVGAGGNLVGRVLAYTGSTRRMDHDVTIASMPRPMSLCGVSISAPDAVFEIRPSSTITATIDSSGSDFQAVVGLFDTTIDAAGYVGCDAPGVAPNTDVTQSGTTASTEPLTASLIGGRTYYVVLTGTETTADGAYTLKLADAAAGGNGRQIGCSLETSSRPARAEADFYANHTYYVIVESNLSTGGPYAMDVYSLYQARSDLENPLAQNESGATAFELPDPHRSKVHVYNTSTLDMAANYTTTGDTPDGELSCGAQSAAPDAVYTFVPSIDSNVRITADMPGMNPVVSLFRGQPGSTPTTTDLAATGNINESTTTAHVVDLRGAPQMLTGDTSLMSNDIDGSLLSCGAALTGRDAVFKFSLAQSADIEIDASASLASGMIGDPVITLFNDVPLEKPAPVTLENDSYTDASVNPSPTPTVTDDWLVYEADVANLTPMNQAQVSEAATNTNEQVDTTSRLGAHDLGDVWNTKVSVGGGDTSAMAADYSAVGWCGGHDDAPDAVYQFHSSRSTQVRISTAYPAPGFDTVIALYDGSTGAPLRKIDGATVSVDLNNLTSACGDAFLFHGEECDDGNLDPGDGCDQNCEFEAGWHCNPAYYGTGDGCDCGCGIVDPDCPDANSSSCTSYPVGSCTIHEEPTLLVDTDNSQCKYAEGVWHCLPMFFGDGDCDCGCGALDVDCGSITAACTYCDAPGSCAVSCADIDPSDNTQCTGSITLENPNDTLHEAAPVDLAAGGTRRFLGDTSALTQDIAAGVIQCGASSTAPDAMFEFTLREPTQVQIDASASSNPPVLALFNSNALGEAPAAVPLSNDDPADADLDPSPTPALTGNWVRYSSDISDFTITAQPQTQIDNRDNVNNDAPTELIDPINRRVTVQNASTSAPSMLATFPAPSCGGVDSAHDALYSFVPGASGQVRISTDYPDTAIEPVIAVYDGTNGLPLQLADLASTTQALGQTHEAQPSAYAVPLEDGSRVYTGSTTGMINDVAAALLQCGAANASDAVWSFSLSEPTDVEISAAGSGYDTVISLFDSPFTRPSVTELRSLAAARTQLYDADNLPGQPEAGCTAYDWNLHRYWFCSTERPWDGAHEKCRAAGHELATIDNQLENDELRARIAPSAKAHQIGLIGRSPYVSWGSSPVGKWADGSTASYRNFMSGEPDQTENASARMRYQDGLWFDAPKSWQAAPYICEQNAPAPLRTPPTSANPQVVDLFGSTRRFVGSTRSTSSSVGALIGCSAEGTAPDAVFRIDLAYATTLSVDFSGSFAGSVIGLFRGGIGPSGYSAAGNTCAGVASAAPQIDASLTPGTYYVVLTGTSTSPSGSYDITFGGATTDPAAFRMENDTLPESRDNPVGAIDNRWAVKTANMANLSTDLLSERTVDMPGTDNNSSHVSPYAVEDLGSITAEQVTIINASTAGLSSDYPAPSCGLSDVTADAIYQFTPTQSSIVRIAVTPTDHAAVVALYDGSNGEYPRLQTPPPAPMTALANTNEAPGSAQPVTIGDPAAFTGNVSAMASHVPTVDANGRPWDRSALNGGDALNACNAAPTGNDAFFGFTLTEAETVVLETAGSDFEHTLALFGSNPIAAPAATTAEHDTRAAASNLTIDDQWYVLQGSTANLAPGGVTRTTKLVGADGTDADALTDFVNDDAIQDLGVLAARTQLVTSGADTSAATVSATYLKQCGGSDTANDMIFKFTSGASAQTVHIGVNDPAPAFAPVLQLFDGSSGDPLTSSEADPVPTAVAGNDSRNLAYGLTLGATPVAFSGNTAGFAADNQAATSYNQSHVHGGAMCSAGAATHDAFYSFTLASPMAVRVHAAGDATAYAHTLALYDSTPITRPDDAAVSPVSQADSRANAYGSGMIGAIDGSWAVRSVDSQGLTISELSATSDANAPDGTTASLLDGNADAYVDGEHLTVSTGSTASYAGHYPRFDDTSNGSPMCGSSDTAPDAIYRLVASTTRDVRIALGNPSFAATMALFDGSSGDPLTLAELEPASTTALGTANDLFQNAQSVTIDTTVAYTSDPVGSDMAGSVFDNAAAPGTCSADAAGEDAFFTFTLPTTTTTIVYVGADTTAGDHTLALFDRDPRYMEKPEPGSGSFASNIDTAVLDFSTAPSWSCTGTTTIDSTGTGSISSPCGGVTPPFSILSQADSSGPQAMVVRLSSLSVASGATLRLIGDKPVLLLVNGNATIDGVVDASASGTTSGAGGNWSCSGSTGGAGTGSASFGSSGGGGGGFGTAGGVGGDSVWAYEYGGAGGSTRGVSTLRPLMGGCGGGVGGGCSTNYAGAGGGAVQISAAGTLDLNGTVRADGAQGTAGCLDEGGGGGGGSGGAVLLEGAVVDTAGAMLSARGGTGGNGATGTAGGSGSTTSSADGGAGADDRYDGGGGGGGGYGRVNTRVIVASAGAEHDVASEALMVPYTAVDDAWTVRTADTANLSAEWAVPSALLESSYTTGEDGSNPLVLGDTTSKHITIDGDTGMRVSNHDEICGGDGGADTVYEFTPSQSGQLRIQVEASAALDPDVQAPIVAVYDAAPTVNYGGCWGDVSNFDPSNTSLSYTAAVNVTCGVTIDTSLATTSMISSSGCTPGWPTPVIVNQSSGTGPQLVIIPMASFTLGAGHTITVRGDKPAVFAVDGDALVEGTIDASASGTTAGAGGNLSSHCGTGGGGSGDTSDNSYGAGGGGGGGFGTAGGAGASTSYYAGGPAGVAASDSGGDGLLVPLRGGCGGGRGGDGAAASSGGLGGAGGGAVQLSVSGTLSVMGTARIGAAGAGGAVGSTDEAGGGGGGSGGGVLLEASIMDIRSGAWVTANAGGGGEGQLYSGTGADPGDSGSIASATAAAGGSGNTGGDGGNGGVHAKSGYNATTTADPGPGLVGDSSARGAGGGGGGHGVVLTRELSTPSTCGTPPVIDWASNIDQGASGFFTGAVAWTCTSGTSTTPVTTTIHSGSDANGTGASVGSCGGVTPPFAIVDQTTAGGPKVMVVKLTSLDVGQYNTIAATGYLPVVIAVDGAAAINGTVHASASGSTPGAGGGYSCTAGAGGQGSAGTNSTGGAGGAGGAGFGIGGGGGGSGQGAAGVSGGSSVGSSSLIPLRGGCGGGNGGGSTSSGSGSGPAGGKAGGAIQISAKNTFTIGSTGVVGAAGAGGLAPNAAEQGGAGGGSGGAVLLEGSSVSLDSNSWISVNGGGGSGGADTTSTCSNGGAAGSLTSTTQAAGGGACNSSGAGGAGGVLVYRGTTQTVASSGMNGTDESGLYDRGGGGGGGGYGRVVINATGGGSGSAGTLQFGSASLVTCVTDGDTGNLAGSQTKTDADATSGATTITDLAVTAGTTYYIVVKSGSSAGNGEYDLALTWKDSQDWAGCSEELYSGVVDGFFAFTTQSTGAATYTIETQGSISSSAIALFDGSGTFLACDDTSSGPGFASLSHALAASTTYYVRVKQASGTINLGVRDDGMVQNTMPAALACDDGSASAVGALETTLPAGTYWVGVKGKNAYTGAYTVRFRDQAVLGPGAEQLDCRSVASGGSGVIDATLQGGRDYYVIVKGDGASDSGSYGLEVVDRGSVTDMACSEEDRGAPDAYFEFDVSAAGGIAATVDVEKLHPSVVHRYEFAGQGNVVDDFVGTADGFVVNDALNGDGTLGLAGGTTEQHVNLPNGVLSSRTNATLEGWATWNGGNAGQRLFDFGSSDTGEGSQGNGVTYAYFTPSNGTSARFAFSTAGSGAETFVDVGPLATGSILHFAAVFDDTNDQMRLYLNGALAGSAAWSGALAGLSDVNNWLGRSQYTAHDELNGTLHEFRIYDAALTASEVLSSYAAGADPSTVAWELWRDVGSDGATANDTLQSSACYEAAASFASLAQGKYYVKARGTGTERGVLYASIRDDGRGSLGCADGTSATPASIDSNSLPATAVDAQGRLPAGTYYVAFSGQGSNNGAYELIFSDPVSTSGGSTPLQCTTGQALSATLSANTDYYLVVKGNAATDQGAYTLAVTDVTAVEAIDSACATDVAAPDGYAEFSVTSGPRDVRIDMSGSTLSGAFQVKDSSGAAVAGCPCSPTATPITCSLGAGTYYVVYRGSSVAAGAGAQPFELVLRDESALGSIACADGAISTGASITQTLSAGTYYVGIIPTSSNASTDFDYRLEFKDQASVLGATQVACSATEIEAAVDANTPYYVVVKGQNAGDEGSYGLTVQDMSGVPSFGCGDDTLSGDGFYTFEVDNAGGANVTIDTEGSMLETVIALFPDNGSFSTDLVDNSTGLSPPDGKPDAMLACDSSSGAGGSSRIDRHLAPGVYHVVVRARQGAPDPNLPFNISLRDSDSLASSYCDATDATDGQARIRQTLQPGTYWVALSGLGSAAVQDGAYQLGFRDYAPFANPAPELACDTASDTIYYDVEAGKPYYVMVKGDTALDQGSYKLTVENLQVTGGPGCNADPQSPDAFYKFSLSAPTTVSIDVSGTLDSVIALYEAGASYFGSNYADDVDNTMVPCDDDGGVALSGVAGSSHIGATLPAGDYYLLVKGKTGTGASWGSTSQPFTVSVRDANSNTPITCALASSPVINELLPAGDYKLVVSDDGVGGPYDIGFKDLSVVTDAATQVACDSASDTITYDVAADRPYYVVVKGHGAATAAGSYGLTVESVDTSATTIGCGADPKSPDAFFKFNVAQQTEVALDTDGSALDTVLAIYPGNATVFGTDYATDAFGETIYCDDDGGTTLGASKIATTLAPGDYYAVVKGAASTWDSSSQPFNLSIRDAGATRAITCANAGSGGKIVQTLPAGDYTVVLSDTQNAGTTGSGGAYSITFRDLNTTGSESGVEIGCALGTLDGGDSDADGQPDGLAVEAGQPYYVVVKGNTAADAGNYTLTVDDVVSTQAAAGSTPIACAAEGGAVDAVYPPGEYYALVSGPSATAGAYELVVRDVEPFLDYNAVACDAGSGPNGTSVIETEVDPGTYYVVVEGDGAGQKGKYRLNLRDVDAHPDQRLACAGAEATERLEYDVVAGQDYTVLLKGDAAFQEGAYDIKLYDALGLQGGTGENLHCQTICPNVAPYNSSSSADYCSATMRSTTSFTTSLAPDTYYLTVKGRRAHEKGFYELQIGDPTDGSNLTQYVPPTWTQVRDSLRETGVKVLPVSSCSFWCSGPDSQAEVLARTTGVVDPATGQGLVQKMDSDGTGVGSKLASAVRDVANWLSMDISLSVWNNPGFLIDIQKCTNPADSGQASCQNFTTGCQDTTAFPKNTIYECTPGATPKFMVQFTNPLDPDSVPPNPDDPYGGYHFKLQIYGDQQYLLDEVPVYIIPTDTMGPMPSGDGDGAYQSSGSYEQEIYGAGCNYYQLENESASGGCSDGIDNNANGLVDGDDDACKPGSCLDGVDNDGDGTADINDPDCATNEVQDWTDLFFRADVPFGTNVIFDVCTGETAADLDTCTMSRIASLTSASGSCATDAECLGVNLGGVVKDGFCGAGGQCQFIDPPKLSGHCTDDSQCANGSINGETVASTCEVAVNQCRYTTPPADIGNNLMSGENGKPYMKVRITLNANAAASQSPTLFDWYATYNCRALN